MLYHPNLRIFHGENDLMLCASYYLIGRGSEILRFLGIYRLIAWTLVQTLTTQLQDDPKSYSKI